MGYKWCVVPACTNTSIKTPEKLFLCVPKNVKVRKKWLKLARRNPNDIVDHTVVFFCEDHFDIEKDIANYYQYKMGYSQRIIMAHGVLPSKFYCQQDRRKKICDATTSRPAFVKRQRTELIQEREEISPTAIETASVVQVHMSIGKGCVVPQCTNTSKKKVISVPTDPAKRKMWLTLARRDPDTFSQDSEIFMCEDHFNGLDNLYLSKLRNPDNIEDDDNTNNDIKNSGSNILKRCPKCVTMVESLLMHFCKDESQLPLDRKRYICMVCSREYQSMDQFNDHSVKNHDRATDIYYFPSFDEFSLWKRHMETQTCTTYALVLESNDKKYYYCKYNAKVLDQKIFTLCPSVLVAQEFESGVHVNYFNKHQFHIYEEYNLTDKYKKYSIEHLTKPLPKCNYVFSKVFDSDSYTIFEPFKILIENIVVRSAKLNRDKLKLLMSKALEMSTVLTSHEDKDEIVKKKTKNLNRKVTQKSTVSNELLNNAQEIKEPVIVNAFTFNEIKVEVDSETECDVEMKQEIIEVTEESINPEINIEEDVPIKIEKEDINYNECPDINTDNVNQNPKTRKKSIDNKIQKPKNKDIKKEKNDLTFSTYNDLLKNSKPSVFKPRVSRRRKSSTNIDRTMP